MKIAYLYCDRRSLNDATNYYVDIIKDCIIQQGFSFEVVHKLKDIKSPDLIMTITGRYFLFAKIKHPFVKTIYWAQGLSAEEAKWNLHGISSYLRYIFRRFSEPVSVNCCDILFVVSERMIRYFGDVYNYHLDKKNYIVMPCYNLKLSEYFDINQYKTPTFVYAGNSSVWQGVDFMLDVYALIESKLPDAKLIIYSKDKLVFEDKLKERGISNFEIKYVPVTELQKELHKYKYGFILRDNHIVNQVSTPTKMNSYLSNYLIPIFSDTVDDFKRHVKLGEFTIMANYPLEAQKVVQQIVDFENSVKDFFDYKNYVAGVFASHYSDVKYKFLIEKKLSEMFCKTKK